MTEPSLAALAVTGILAGLFMLGRGFAGYRTARRIADTGTSSISSLAAGEVRIAGIVEAAELTLTSPLQSRPCIYYRASIRDDDDGSDLEADFFEERGVGFLVRDATGTIRIFPRHARWDAPIRYASSTGPFGALPPDLHLRTGSATGMAEEDRAAAVARLLTVQPATSDAVDPALGDTSGGRRRYEEARLAPGDAVTILGRAMPFSDLTDPQEADVGLGAELAWDDPEVAANIAEAREAGLLKSDPADAWGNAAIPGFGIGRPVRTPVLDVAADPLPIAPAEEAARIERRFHIPPAALVLASAPDEPLLIAHGLPGAAAERHQDRFVVGLLGAMLSIASAVGLAILLAGGTAS